MATSIASQGSMGPWTFALNKARSQAAAATVTTTATVPGARNRQHSGTVTSGRKPACTATGPGNVTFPPCEDKVPFCARSTAPNTRMARGTSHQETADHSRSARFMPRTYARPRAGASPWRRSPARLASAPRRSRAVFPLRPREEPETRCSRRRDGRSGS